MVLKKFIRRNIRMLGWDVRRFDRLLALDTFLPELFEAFGVNCVLDIGAHIGNYGASLRSIGYGGRIVSFEPVEENFSELARRTNGDQNWEAFPYALGAESGSAEINVSKASSFSSFLPANQRGLSKDTNIAVRKTQTVQVCRLDEVFNTVTSGIEEPRVYLKMDTQGWDLEVFRGSSGCLNQIVALQSELSLRAMYERMTGWQEMLSEYEQAGFAVSGMFSCSHEGEFLLYELDCVMVRSR
jgi:FkbM family methyltransferase